MPENEARNKGSTEKLSLFESFIIANLKKIQIARHDLVSNYERSSV